MLDLCALLKRCSLARNCADCGEPRCLCLRQTQLEERQGKLDRWLQAEVEEAFAEARARWKGRPA